MNFGCWWILAITHLASAAKANNENGDALNASTFPWNRARFYALEKRSLEESKTFSNKSQEKGISKLTHRDQGLLIDTAKLPRKAKHKIRERNEKSNETVEKTKKKTKCYKSFSWCQRHSKTTSRKTECQKELKQCVLTACKKANQCNPSFETCFRKSKDDVEGKYKCYEQWKSCAERVCSTEL